MTANPASTAPMNHSISTTENAERPGILVVDDDQTVLGLLQIVFAGRGFQVWTASTGRSAVELYRQHQEAVSVVLLDVRMPDLDGPQTLAELRRINPGVRASFMSGFTGKYSSEELLALGAECCFEKPFEIHPLCEQLWQLALTGVRRSA